MTPRQTRREKKVTERRWGLLWPNRGGVTVGPKGYPKYAAKQDAAMQRAKVVRVTLTYTLPKERET